MTKPAAGDFRNGMAVWRDAAFRLLLLALAAAPAWPQQLAQDELGTTAGRTFTFQTFQGRGSVIQSAQEIVGIGEVLWRTLRVDGKHGTYFGKYEVIRAFDPSLAGLLGADIIVIDAAARVNTLDNIQRVVAGYLAAAFGLAPAEAARVGGLVTRYNAAHRGDMPYLSGKYAPAVMSYLTAQNAGLALSYADWPGKTRLLIPLGHAANGQPSVAVAPRQAGGAAGGTSAGSAGAAGTGSAGTGGAAGGAGSAGTGGAGATAEGATGAAAGTGSAGGAAGTGATGGTGATSGTGGATAAGTAGGGAGSAGGTGAAGQAGGTGAEGSAQAGEAAGSPAGSTATAAGSANEGAAAASPEGSQAGTGWLGRFLTSGNGRWLALLLLAAVLILAFVVIRLLRAGLNPAWALAVLQSAREGHPLIEMVVTTQNRHIGMRNVHYLRPGSTATVGGRRSSFLVYFVPVPHGMATLSYDGKRYTFTPRTSELFPSLDGPLGDCLGQPIAAQSTRGYKFTIVFHTFVSPLEEVNRLMRSIRVPR